MRPQRGPKGVQGTEHREGNRCRRPPRRHHWHQDARGDAPGCLSDARLPPEKGHADL